GGEAREGCWQYVYTAHADRHGLAATHLEGTLLVLGARYLQVGRAVTVGVGECQRLSTVVETNPHALEGAGEEQFINSAARKITGREGLASWGDLDFLGAH